MAAPAVANPTPAPISDGPKPGGPAANAAPVHNSSLYVGDLDREVTEAQLFELFSQVGPVASIRVCRDAVTRRSLGYAYVNYNAALDDAAAERALETLNYATLGGRPMRLMWSHRDPAFRKSGVGNIFIKNLDRSIDNKALHDTFSAFGAILSCKVAMDAAGVSKGYGFVHFVKEESAQLAIDKVNGMLLEGKKVYVGPFLARNDRPADKDAQFTNVYVKNLAESVSQDQLTDMFAKYGVVTSAIIMTDEGGKSKGFGFVNFEDVDAAADAVGELNGKVIDGKELYAGRAQKKTEREASLKAKFDEKRNEQIAKYQGLNLYIKNLADGVDDDKLRAEFTNFGTITSAKVMKDGQGKSKGFGFVCYTLPEDATRAVTEMNGRMLQGKPMYVALAQRRDVRRAQLEQQYTARMPQVAPGRPGQPMGPPMGPFPGAPMFYGGPPAAMGPQGGRGPGPMQGYPQMMGPGGRGMGPGQGGPGRGGRGMGGPQMGFPMQPHGGPMPMMGGPIPGGRGRSARGGRGRQDLRGDGGPRGGRVGEGRGRGRGAQQPAPPAERQHPAPPAPPAPAASGVVPGQEGGQLTTAMLAAAPPEQQKQMLGERLFPQVARIQPELAGKITGMLLEMDNSELLLLLESHEALDSKVNEAIQVLKQHNALPVDTTPIHIDPALQD